MNKDIYKDAVNEIRASEDLKNKVKYERKSNNGFALKICAALCVFLMVFSVAIFKSNPYKDVLDEGEQVYSQESNLAMKLPTLGSVDKYKEIATTIIKNNNQFRFTSGLLEAETNMAESVTDTAVSKSEFSTTNVQVEGVDEADKVKTDGKFIYFVRENGAENEVVIFDINKKEIASRISVKDKFKNSYLRELFLYKNKLVVLGAGYNYRDVEINTDDTSEDKSMALVDLAYETNTMFALVYDISDRTNVKEDRIIEIEGDYISSRMINDNVYIVTCKYAYYYNEDYLKNLREEDIVPEYRDTAVDSNYRCKSLDSIYYLPGTEELNMINVASFSVENKEEVKIESFLGAGSTVYANQNSLYITRTKYEYENDDGIISGLFSRNSKMKALTAIYKLALNDGNIEYKASTEVNGFMNSQFSMDEYNGNLRVAVTAYRGEENETVNNLYILNENLETVGAIDDMAVGEKIYSVRFLGNKGYVVTFKQVDPLFVIDLSVPENPQILGELKIPGYSSYLHPYDENHVIGIGYNTEETSYGTTTNSGMKLSLFDVSDVKNPVEIANTSIGERGTYSEATYNHKAILFSKEKNILAFPISISKTVGEYSTNNIFNGAIVYNIDLENGFSEAGRIASSDKPNQSTYEDVIRRIIYIEDKYYTIAENVIKIADMNNCEVIDTIRFD